MSDQLFDYQKSVPEILRAMAMVNAEINKTTLERRLVHLVELRASQINGCAFCVNMHTSDARNDGESNKRLDQLIVWRSVSDFTAAEKAAFAWTEALTNIDQAADFEALRSDLAKHFDAEQIGALTATISIINLWNRVQISTH